MWYLLITNEITGEQTRRDLTDKLTMPLPHQLDYIRANMLGIDNDYFRFEKITLKYQHTDTTSYTQFGLSVPADATFDIWYGSRSRKNPR